MIRSRPGAAFGVVACAASLGALTFVLAGIPPQLAVAQLAFVTAGFLLAKLVARLRSDVPLAWAVALASAAMGATAAFGTSYCGATRWASFGPVRVQVSSTLVPFVVVGVALLQTARERTSCLLIGAAALAVGAQPSGSDALGLTAGAAVMTRSSASRWTVGATVLSAMTAAVALLRDPSIPPVPHVEGVVHLAAEVHPALAILVIVAAAATPLTPLLVARGAAGAPVAAGALSAYLAVQAAIPLARALPVPIVGYGAGPILGLSAALGLLAARARRDEARAATTSRLVLADRAE